MPRIMRIYIFNIIWESAAPFCEAPLRKTSTPPGCRRMAAVSCRRRAVGCAKRAQKDAQRGVQDERVRVYKGGAG